MSDEKKEALETVRRAWRDAEKRMTEARYAFAEALHEAKKVDDIEMQMRISMVSEKYRRELKSLSDQAIYELAEVK